MKFYLQVLQHVVDEEMLLHVLLLLAANSQIQVHGNRPQQTYRTIKQIHVDFRIVQQTIEKILHRVD